MPHAESSRLSRVRVAFARTSELAEGDRAPRALAWLEPADRDRYERFRGADDRLMFLLGRLMARSLVGRALGVAPTAWRWGEGPRGRPEIDDPPTPLRFNLAHSAGLVVCAVAADRDVGVDVEDLQRRRVDRELVRRYCAPAEIADVDRHGPAWHDRFLLYWTLKEAYLKARGVGIAVQLSDISFSFDGSDPKVGFIGSLAQVDDRWSFHIAQPTDRHLVAVAAPTDDGRRPQFEVAPFDWTASGLPVS